MCEAFINHLYELLLSKIFLKHHIHFQSMFFFIVGFSYILNDKNNEANGVNSNHLKGTPIPVFT